MTENNLTKTTNAENIEKNSIEELLKITFEATVDANNISKEKYSAKLKLIAGANDMSTQEKLDAMDRNYNCWNEERWKNVFHYALAFFSIYALASLIGSQQILQCQCQAGSRFAKISTP